MAYERIRRFIRNHEEYDYLRSVYLSYKEDDFRKIMEIGDWFVYEEEEE